MLHKEDGQILYVIVIMKKFIAEYIQAAASRKFIARTDFDLDLEQQTKETEAVSKLETDIKTQWVNNNFISYIFDVDIKILFLLSRFNHKCESTIKKIQSLRVHGA